MRRRSVRILVAAAVAGVGFASVPGPASASCAPPPPIEQGLADAGVVMVGTVMTVTNADRWADVRVEEIWKGRDLPAIVQVRGGVEPGTATSVDRTYEPGTRYLFVVRTDAGYLSDDSCTLTQPYGPQLERHRPDAPRTPVTSPTTTPDGEPTSAADAATTVSPGLVVLAVALGFALLLFTSLLIVARRAPRS